VFNSTVNFIVPPLIYIAMVRRQQQQAARHLITDVSLLMHPELNSEEIIEDFNSGHSLVSASIAVMRAAGTAPPGLPTSPSFGTTPQDARPRSASSMRKDYQMRVSRPGSAVNSSHEAVRGGSVRVGPHSVLNETLLGADHASSSAALYDANGPEADSEEAITTRVLGYDPYEAARDQDRLREETLREAAEELKRHHGRVTLSVPSIGDPSMHVEYEADMSRSHTRAAALSPSAAGGSAAGAAPSSGTGASVAVISRSQRPPSAAQHFLSPSPDDLEAPLSGGGRVNSAAGDMSHLGPSLQSARDGSFMVLSSLGAEPWAAMPRWLLPHRILLAKAVAAVLGACALVVIGLNIVACAKGDCN